MKRNKIDTTSPPRYSSCVFDRVQTSWPARVTRLGIRALAACWMAAALLFSPAVAAPVVPAPPKADVFSVDIARKPLRTVVFSGAGIRPPQARDDGVRAETVLVKWLAHSPGIPPGALVMLETVSERLPTVKTRIQRLPPKTEGNQTTRFEIPVEDTRQDGPVESWRVRIVWRGRILAAKASGNWGEKRP